MVSDKPSNELTRRREALLLAAVQEFIATAAPVGSHQIVSRHSLGVRAASVRSMMAELEEAGYLRQPHTSAGRIPTDKAFRYYVDRLLQSRQIGFEDRTQIELHYSAGLRDLNEIMRDTSRFLALLTGQAAVVMAPRLEEARLEQVRFVRVRESQVLAIFTAAAGGIHHRLIETEQDYAQEDLDRMGRYLNESLQGRTLEEARRWIERQLKEEQAAYDRFMRAALVLGEAIAVHPSHTEIYVEGSAKALEQPEFADPGKLRELLRVLEDKSALVDLLEQTLESRGLSVTIGSEIPDSRLNAFSVVAASYASGSMPLGSLAVLGPVRMDYGRVIPLVRYTARALSRVLEH
jgi:heat-inducible transcriptional repressor